MPVWSDELAGELLIYNAGSLSIALRDIAAAFEAAHPNVTVLSEASGSQTAARKIMDLDRPCDLLLSADHAVVEELLIPDYAAWQIPFARNALVLAYRDGAPRADELEDGGWIDVVLDPEIDVAYCNPDTAPCGYRAIQCLLLAETHFDRTGIAQTFRAKGGRLIRSQESEVLSLLESGAVDYAFTYCSSAEQRGLPFLALPPEIDLSNLALAQWYDQATVKIAGDRPGVIITVHGLPMVYSLTIPNGAPNPKLALAFAAFFLEKDHGLVILRGNHFTPAVPTATPTYAAIPQSLQRFAAPPAP